MAIVKMKRLRLIALARDRDALLSSLLHVGCVEVKEPSAYLADEAYSALLRRDTAAVADAKSSITELKQALDVLGQYAPYKGGLFAQRAQVREGELLDEAARRAALEKAREINAHAKTIGALNAREARVKADQMALRPWSACDLPLELKGTAKVDVLLGTVPNTADFNALAGAAEEAAGAVEIRRLSSDREQQYLEVLVHKDCRQAALEAMRSYGFAFAQLRDLTGTAQENIQRLDVELQAIDKERNREIAAIEAMGPCRDELKKGVDRMGQVLATESAKERLLPGGSVVYLDGWCEVPEVPALEKALAKFECAYELSDPAPEEYPDVPVKLKNNVFSRCMNVVTEMYSLPAYDGIDPNPLMAPFFILFFGIMMADMAYGILMVAASLVVLKKMRPKAGTRNFMELVFWCGISTFIVGAMTGGFFGDFIPQLVKLINPASTFTMPALFTPLDDTVAIMVGSVILGVVQIFTGMTISVVKKIKEGDFIDALFSEFTWWIILAGVALFAVSAAGVAPIPSQIGIAVLVIGFLMLAIGGTRNAKGFGKVTSLIGLIYNGVTGYFSDALSYVRLMALMLSGSVIASVFNTLGATFGGIPVIGIVLFVVVSMVGNALNLALNLLGCYVHDLRLQCLEFFNRFYKEGGKPYRPLAIETKYVDVIKEEQ